MVNTSNTEPIEILLVEDNPGDARLAAEALKENKVRNNLYHVKDGVEAMRFLRRQAEYADAPLPDLVLLDLNLPRKDGHEVLKEMKGDAKLRLIEALNFPFDLASDEEWSFHRPIGCDRCGGTGYKGRIGIYEMMVVSDETKKMILRRVSANEIARTAEEEGMVRLREDGLVKAAQGVTTIEEVLKSVV
jgi:CheY-like chemotaxis protein